MKSGNPALILLVVLLAALSTSVASAQDKQLEEWKKSTWRIAIDLDMPDLIPPAVQWSVLDEDPVPGFKERVEKMATFNRKRLQDATDPERAKMIRQSQMEVAWDLGFKSVTGDNIYLLTSAAGVSHSFSSNAPAGKKWIVTKTVNVKGESVCWCLPVETEIGKGIEVTLAGDNAFDLAATFDEVMKKESLAE